MKSHKKIFILGAVCLSILIIVLAFKISDYQNKKELARQAELKKEGDSGLILSVDKNSSSKIANLVDEFKLRSLASSTNPLEITEKDTLTSQVSKQLLLNYAKEQAGIQTTDSSSEASNIINSLNTKDLPQAKYGLQNIKIMSPATLEGTKAYGNQFATIYINYAKGVRDNQEKYAANTDLLAKMFEDTGQELLKLNVPAEISGTHLDLVNNYYILGQGLRMLKDQDKDPIKALLGLRSVKSSFENINTGYLKLATFFQKSGIIYDKTESGAIWNKIENTAAKSK